MNAPATFSKKVESQIVFYIYLKTEIYRKTFYIFSSKIFFIFSQNRNSSTLYEKRFLCFYLKHKSHKKFFIFFQNKNYLKKETLEHFQKIPKLPRISKNRNLQNAFIFTENRNLKK